MREGHGLDAIGRLIAQCEVNPRGRPNADLVADARADLNAYRAMIRILRRLRARRSPASVAETLETK